MINVTQARVHFVRTEIMCVCVCVCAHALIILDSEINMLLIILDSLICNDF